MKANFLTRHAPCVFFMIGAAACPLVADEFIHSIQSSGTPGSALPGSAKHLVDAGVYKGLDCVLQGDRFEYWQDDQNGQLLAILPARETNAPARARFSLARLDGAKETPLASVTTEKTLTNKFSFLVSMPALKAGKYRVKAAFVDDAGAVISSEAVAEFAKADKKNPVIPIPADGIPIVLEKQEFVADATWPVRTGVPLPVNAVMDASRLALFENGAPIPAQITPVATWCPKGSVQWVHLDFVGRYTQGEPAEYRLKLPPQAGTSPTSPLTCEQTADKITVDTGPLRFEVKRKRFTGIAAAWFNGAQVITNSAGPYLEDARIIRFDAANDTNAAVVVEEQGAASVTIRAEGWYVNNEGRVDPLCKFVTRITAYAGQPMLRVSHHTILTYDTRTYRLGDVGFHIGSTLGEQFRLGADGATKKGALPPAPRTVFLHQDRHDHFRIVGTGTTVIEGAKSDGWFSIAPTNATGASLTVVLRDIWQKFPKEVEMARDGVTLHFWPKHGHRAFALGDELSLKNIYKFWCFHQGGLLDLMLPNDYFDKLSTDYASGTFECRPEHALNGNGQGLAIGNEFAILFSAPGEQAEIPKQARLFQFDPTAAAPPDWNASTWALGKMAGVDRGHFAPMEEAIEQGWLSHTRCVERANEYGMWIWPDTHTYWNAEEDYAELHRVWHNSHYHEIGQNWLMYFRSGSSPLLRWARAHSDHWMNIGTVNYAELDENGRPKFKFHHPGAMYHCKGLTPWGGEDYGMKRRDGHAGVAGHWTDPDAFLWDWYMTGNRRARDVYEMWAATYSKAPWHGGTRREANTTFAMMLNYYRASWNTDILPAIRGMGLSLRTHEPLEKQQPGPMWHALWINRYFDLTRDPGYVPFILQYGRMPGMENCWTTALGALAYELSGDQSYLTQHFERAGDFQRMFYRAPGDPYDWYGAGPGPIGDGWGAYLSWGYFLQALQQARITSLTPEKITRFSYLVGGKPSLTVYALENKDRPIQFTFKASSLGGDLHQCDCRFLSPSGKELANFRVPPRGGPSSWTEKKELAADGETGLYRFELNTYEANVSAPVTDLPFEAMSIPKDLPLETRGVCGFLRPTDETKTVELTIHSGGRRKANRACNLVITDATGKVLLQDSLFAARGRKSAAITLDPATHKLPWKIDVYGQSSVIWNGESEQLFLGPSDEAVRAIIAAQNK